MSVFSEDDESFENYEDPRERLQTTKEARDAKLWRQISHQVFELCSGSETSGFIIDAYDQSGLEEGVQPYTAEQRLAKQKFEIAIGMHDSICVSLMKAPDFNSAVARTVGKYVDFITMEGWDENSTNTNSEDAALIHWIKDFGTAFLNEDEEFERETLSFQSYRLSPKPIIEPPTEQLSPPTTWSVSDSFPWGAINAALQGPGINQG